MRVKLDNKYANCAGVVLVEFALAAFLFLFIIFAVVDCARYMAIRINLNKAVHVALNQAIKTPDLEYNLNLYVPAASPQVDDNQGNSYAAFDNARDNIINLATTRAKGLFVAGSGESGAAKLTRFCLEDGATMVDALVLRPGDRYKVGDCSGGAPFYDHPTRSAAVVSAASNIKLLMRNEPIVVRMSVAMKPLTPFPFLPILQIDAMAAGYREDNPAGAFPAPLASLLLVKNSAIG